MLTSLSAKSMVLLERGIVKGDCIPHSARTTLLTDPVEVEFTPYCDQIISLLNLMEVIQDNVHGFTVDNQVTDWSLIFCQNVQSIRRDGYVQCLTKRLFLGCVISPLDVGSNPRNL